MSEETLRSASADEPLLSKLCSALIDQTWDPELVEFKRFQEGLSVINGMVPRGERIMIPEVLKRNLPTLAHEGHPGMALKNAD